MYGLRILGGGFVCIDPPPEWVSAALLSRRSNDQADSVEPPFTSSTRPWLHLDESNELTVYKAHIMILYL